MRTHTVLQCNMSKPHRRQKPDTYITYATYIMPMTVYMPVPLPLVFTAMCKTGIAGNALCRALRSLGLLNGRPE